MARTLSILLIEDDQIEKMKLHRTISKLGLNHKITEADNGEEALNILKGDTRLPDIIFLDLNMPKINGLEFLKLLKTDDKLKYLPTIVLTTSSNYKDLMHCYEIGIAGYVTKPLKYEDYIQKIKAVLEYWSINELING